MTATTKITLKGMAEKFRPHQNLDTVMDSLNQSWRRDQKSGEVRLGKFSRTREDLTEFEIDYALDWFKADAKDTKVVSVAPTPTPSVSSQVSSNNFDDKLNMAIERERIKLQVDFERFKSTESQRIQAETQAKINECVVLESQRYLDAEKILKTKIEELELIVWSADNKVKQQVEKQRIELEEQIELLNSQLVDLENTHLEQIAGLKKERDECKEFAAKWEKVEKSYKKELFLRRLNFAYLIVACLVIVQGVEASLFTQLAYKDAGFEGVWVKVVGGILCVGFQGIGLFLTVNRKKTFRAIVIGHDEYGNAIYKKNEKGEVETEPHYNMTTMKIICCIDFLINCFVFFGNAQIDEDYGKIARLLFFSIIPPICIFITSEILLNIIDKREKQLSL